MNCQIQNAVRVDLVQLEDSNGGVMYKDLELQESVTKQDLRKYGFCFTKGKYEFFKKLCDNIGVTFIVNISDNNGDKFINYKITNLNTGNPYTPCYSMEYSNNNEVADRVKERLMGEVDKMIEAGIVK